jgi:hypothetical protein
MRWKKEVKCANVNIKGTIRFEKSMCMFEHVSLEEMLSILAIFL